MQNALRNGLLVLSIAFAALAAFNVFADNSEVTALATREVCGASAPCKAQLTENSRTPFGQTFRFVTGGVTKTVTCRRAAVMLGAYACAKGD